MSQSEALKQFKEALESACTFSPEYMEWLNDR